MILLAIYDLHGGEYDKIKVGNNWKGAYGEQVK